MKGVRFLAQGWQACRFFLVFSLITGLIYPLVLTGLAQVFFPWRANGSMLEYHNQIIGSQWIGQQFSDDRYFWGRPSATKGYPYNGLVSAGSNSGPSNPAYLAIVKARIDHLKSEVRPIPVALVTASGSGLDPDIDVEAALYQIGRIAQARQIPVSELMHLVQHRTIQRAFGFLGEPRVNVLALNMALDDIQEQHYAARA